MREAERLLSASAVTIDEEAPHCLDAKYCLGEYFRELSERFESGFDPLQSDSPTTSEFTPPDGTFLIVRFCHRPVGCGAFKRLGPRTAYLKRMWIARDARGLGLGKRLLDALEDRAWSVGYRKIRLETNKALSEARRLYKHSGYTEIEAFGDEKYAHHWFEKVLRSPATDAS
jgi:GNAT superfamily N-acetyltransferase